MDEPLRLQTAFIMQASIWGVAYLLSAGTETENWATPEGPYRTHAGD
jgi:hypothetical protein